MMLKLRSGATFFLVFLGVLPNASAQQASAEGEFSVQRFEPVPGPRNVGSVAGGRTFGEWTWSAGMAFDYARDPFVIRSCLNAQSCSDPNAALPEDTAVVQDLLTWNLLASVTPIPRLQIGLRVPVVYASGAGVDLSTGGPGAPISSAAMGDLALEAKFRIYGDIRSPLVLAAAADLAAPLGHATADGSYVGNSSPVTGGIRGILDVHAGSFLFLANLRGVFREAATLGETTVGPEMRYGMAAGYAIERPSVTLTPFLEGFGATRFSGQNGTNALEIGGGVQVKPPPGPGAGQFVLSFGGGAGLLQGIGVPLARGMFGLTFFLESSDADGDGIADDADQCPTKAEDKDGIADQDGCPEVDFDHDKIPDDVDQCPDKPETENGFKDDDGCPDLLVDADGDGVGDDRDRCPKEKGTILQGEYMGCPDADGDGVPDSIDACPDEKEDGKDGDGCPAPKAAPPAAAPADDAGKPAAPAKPSPTPVAPTTGNKPKSPWGRR